MQVSLWTVLGYTACNFIGTKIWTHPHTIWRNSDTAGSSVHACRRGETSENLNRWWHNFPHLYRTIPLYYNVLINMTMQTVSKHTTYKPKYSYYCMASTRLCVPCLIQRWCTFLSILKCQTVSIKSLSDCFPYSYTIGLLGFTCLYNMYTSIVSVFCRTLW